MRPLLLICFLVCATTLFAQQAEEQLAAQYFGSGEFDKAAELYEKLNRDKPASVYFYDNLLQCYFNLKQFDEAEKLVRKQQRRNEGNAFYRVDLGYVYRKRGMADKAVEWYESLFKKFKGTDLETGELANAFQKRGETDYAIKTYLLARKANGGSSGLYAIQLAQLYANKRDTRMVIEEYLNALRGNPGIIEEMQEYLQLYMADNRDYDQLKAALIKRSKEEPGNDVYSELLIWIYVQKKDFPNALVHVKALDKRFRDEGRRTYDLGIMALQNGYYEDAIQCFQYVVDLGKLKHLYLAARMSMLEARNKKITITGNYTADDLKLLESQYIELLNEEGRSNFTASSMRELAKLRIYYLDKMDAGIELYRELIDMSRIDPRFKAETKLQLGDIYVLKNEVWEAMLLYGQVDKEFLEDPLGQEAKFRNARLSYFVGEFEWARAQLDVLKTATSQLIANDALELSLLIQDNTQDSLEDPLLRFARADLHFYQRRNDAALAILDSIQVLYPEHSLADDILYKRAQIWIEKKDYPKALGYLERILSEHQAEVLADNALFLQADVYQNKLHDQATALKLYEKFIADYPGSFFLTEVRRRYRALRGDAF